MTKLAGAYRARRLDKIEDAMWDALDEGMWDALDEGSFGQGVNAGDLVAHLAVLALKAVEEIDEIENLPVN